MHGIMWCDGRSIHSTAERGLSAPLSGPMARRADCRWLTQPTASAEALARLSHSVNASIALRGPTVLLRRPTSRRLALRSLLLACSCLLACLRAHCCFLMARIDCLHGRMAETALRGCYGLTDGLWHQSLYACTRADSLQWPQKPFLGDLRRFGKQMG